LSKCVILAVLSCCSEWYSEELESLSQSVWARFFQGNIWLFLCFEPLYRHNWKCFS